MIRRDDLYPTPIADRTPMPENDSTVVDVARLATLAADQHTIRTQTPTDTTSLLVERVPADHRIEAHDLEKYLEAPRRPRGATTVHDPADFAAYVGRIVDPHTTVWADQRTRTVTAVINDALDVSLRDDDRPGDGFGWRDHTVSLELQVDPEWAAWLALDGDLVGQSKMIEHLERFGQNVTDPDSASMLELAGELRATRSAEFESSYRDATGDLVVRYAQTTKVKRGEKGDLEVPERITIRVAPYLGFPAVDLHGTFLVRVAGEDDHRPGSMTIGYRLIRPDLVLRAAFDEVVKTIDEALPAEVPVYRGVAPTAISAGTGR